MALVAKHRAEEDAELEPGHVRSDVRGGDVQLSLVRHAQERALRRPGAREPDMGDQVAAARTTFKWQLAGYREPQLWPRPLVDGHGRLVAVGWSGADPGWFRHQETPTG